MKKWFREQENRIAVFVFFVTVIAVCSPVITKYCINGHDLDYHLLRIESLKEGILMGRPFGRINVLFFGGAGYASSLFYPDLFLYIPALLRVCGAGINASYHIYIALCICLTYLGTQYCVKKMTGSPYAAIMASVLMVTSPYYLGDIYIRSAVGEYTAFIFLPFILYGIYNVLYEGMDRPYILAIGYAGVLLCHTNTFLFMILFGFAAFVIKWKRFRDNPATLLRLGVTIAVTMLLTAFYWVPAMEMFFASSLKVSEAWIPLEQSALQFSKIFSMDFPGMGYWLIIPALFRVLIKKNPQNRDLIGYADWLLIGGCGFAVLTTDLIPWARLNPYLSFVQFPWRLFVPATAMFAVASSIILSVFIRSSLEPYMQSSSKVLTVVLLVISLAFALRSIGNADITYYDYSDDYYSYKPFTGHVIAGEWLPDATGTASDILAESEHLYSATGDDLPFERIEDRVEADISESHDYVDAPFVYYKGYAASLTDTEGRKISLPVSISEKGTCRVYTGSQTGRLTVYYRGTVLQKLAMTASILTVAGLIVYALYRRKRNGITEEKS
ncbi:MAG: hypothetical protein J5518_03225 [Lachnospiraceae bacterium]|nr:hypothetical protein [Lachnospiraceae bacterium]